MTSLDLLSRLTTIATSIGPKRDEYNAKVAHAAALYKELSKLSGTRRRPFDDSEDATRLVNGRPGHPQWWLDAREEASRALDEWFASNGLGHPPTSPLQVDGPPSPQPE